MQQLINTLIESTEYHLLAAALLGLLVAVNPCQIAICLSALVATNDNGDDKLLMKRSLLFVFGRATLYLLLGTTLFFLFKLTGINPVNVFPEDVTNVVETVLPFFVLALGVFFLVRAIFKHHHNDNCHNSATVVKNHKKAGLFILGFLLACLFCPESAVLFFAMLIPLVCFSPLGILNLVVFALFAILPILFIAKIAQKSITKAQQVETKLKTVQFRINLIAAILLIVMAIWLLV